MTAKPAIAAAPPGFALRMRAFFAGYFVFGGVVVPFFPVWLAARGLSETEIAIVIAVPIAIRVLLTPIAGLFADRAPNRRFAVHRLHDSVGPHLLLRLAGERFSSAPSRRPPAVFTLWYLALPVAEAPALTGVRRFGLDYGRMRIGGSVAFIITNLGSGALLGICSREAIFWVFAAALVISTVVAFVTLPVTPRADARTRRPATRPRSVRPGRSSPNPAFLALLLAGGLIQASHAVLYSFGSIYWRALGFSGFDIGIFWAMGVLARSPLFMWSDRPHPPPRAVRPSRPRRGGRDRPLGALSVRPGVPRLRVLQMPHALTFGAVYVGNQHAIARAVPEELTASAQGVFAMIGGLTMAVATLLAGPLYQALGANAFFVMIIPAAAGLLAILGFYGRWFSGHLS